MAPRMMEDYSDRRTEQIFAKAWECFCEKGYANTTIRDIARRMHASTGVIYNYFDSKEELLNGFADLCTKTNAATFQQIKNEHSGQAAMKKVFSISFESTPLRDQQKNSRGYVGLWNEALAKKEVAETLRSFYAGFKEQLAVFLKQSIENGEIDKNADPETLAGLYLAVFLGLQVQMVVLAECVTQDYLAQVTQRLLGGYWNGTRK